MTISVLRLRKAQRERMARAGEELRALRGRLADAYGVFNRVSDPALLEASILEIRALQVRCDCLLRSIKELNGELEHAACDHRSSRRRRGTRLPADQAAETADQMGV